MTQYAYFNSAVAAPSPVLGWYDTGIFTYPNLPPSSDLLVVTSAQWAARLTNPSGWAVSNGALVAYTPPAPTLTLAQKAVVAMSAGLAITSTGTPSLNGTYDVSATSQDHMQAEMIALLNSSGATFADGTASLVWPDINGTNHTFTPTEAKAFFLSAGAYVAALYKCINGTLSALPAASATIA